MAKRHKKKGLISKLLSKGIILTIQLLSSIVLVFQIYRLNMFPIKYYLLLILLLIIFFIIEMVWITAGSHKKKRTGNRFPIFISKLTSIVLSGVLIWSSVFVSSGNSFLSKVTGSFTQTRVIVVYTMKNSSIEKLSDLKGKTLGIENKTSTKNINEVVSKIKKTIGSTPKTIKYDDYAKLADALYINEVDYIVADQSYLGMLETNHESFEDETKAIYKYEITEKMNAVTTKTDVTDKPFIVYVTGIDIYGSVNTISRADVNLVVCVNPIEKQVLMVSVPRDTQINLNKNGKMDKITHSAMYGINETILTLEDFLALKVNYYAKTNFSGIINIIDALDGIEIDSPYAFTTLHGNYEIKKGKNSLNGEQALCFVRERYALPNGDFDRGKNQQRLLKAMLKKAMSTKIITNYSNILSALEGSFETDMSSDDIKSLITMQIDDMASWEMFNVQVTGVGEYSYDTYSRKGKKTYITVPDKTKLDEIKKVIDKIESGDRIDENDVTNLN